MENLSERNQELHITYPTIQEWSSRFDLNTHEAITTLREVIGWGYGTRPGLLSPGDRRVYFDIHRLIQVIRLLDSLEDRDILAMSYSCPNRLRRYDHALRTATEVAHAQGMVSAHLQRAHRLSELIHGITMEVTAFYQGLS